MQLLTQTVSLGCLCFSRLLLALGEENEKLKMETKPVAELCTFSSGNLMMFSCYLAFYLSDITVVSVQFHFAIGTSFVPVSVDIWIWPIRVYY